MPFLIEVFILSRIFARPILLLMTPPLRFASKKTKMFVNVFFIVWLGRKFEPNPLVLFYCSIDGTWHVSTATCYSFPSWIPSSIVNFFSTLAVRDEVPVDLMKTDENSH